MGGKRGSRDERSQESKQEVVKEGRKGASKRQEGGKKQVVTFRDRYQKSKMNRLKKTLNMGNSDIHEITFKEGTNTYVQTNRLKGRPKYKCADRGLLELWKERQKKRKHESKRENGKEKKTAKGKEKTKKKEKQKAKEKAKAKANSKAKAKAKAKANSNGYLAIGQLLRCPTPIP